MTLTKEQQAAQLLEKLNSLFEGDEGLPKVLERLKVLEAFSEDLKGMDLKKAVEEFDLLKTRQESLVKQIRSSRRGFYVSGIEDIEEFSILKAMVAVRDGRMCRELEIMQQAAKKKQEVLGDAHLKAGQIAGQDSLGGAFIPDQVIPEVIAQIFTRSVFVNLGGPEGSTTRISILEGLSGGTVRVPRFDGGLVAFWIGEEDAYTESIASVGDMTMNPKKLGILVRITDTMRRLQGFGFENLLRQDMTRAAAAKIDYTVAYGTGSDNEPRGIVNHSGIKIFNATTQSATGNTAAELAALDADWAGGELNFDGLQNMQLALEEDDITIDASHAYLSAPRFWQRQKQLKIENYTSQTAGNPYLLGAPFLSNARLAAIIGDFDGSNQIPSSNLPGASVAAPTTSVVVKSTDVFAGNLNNVVLGRWGGIEIDDDAGRGKGFTSDHIYMKLRVYLDVGIRQERSIIVCPDALARD